MTIWIIIRKHYSSCVTLQIFDHFGSTFTMNYLVRYGFGSLTAQKDIDDMKAFFADKDTSKVSGAISSFC